MKERHFIFLLFSYLVFPNTTVFVYCVLSCLYRVRAGSAQILTGRNEHRKEHLTVATQCTSHCIGEGNRFRVRIKARVISMKGGLGLEPEPPPSNPILTGQGSCQHTPAYTLHRLLCPHIRLALYWDCLTEADFTGQITSSRLLANI